MKQLLVMPKNIELTKQERRNLSVNGFLVIQVDDPKVVRLIGSEGAEISGTAIMHAAVRAMSQAPNNSKDSVRETFVKLLDQVFSRQGAASVPRSMSRLQNRHSCQGASIDHESAPRS